MQTLTWGADYKHILQSDVGGLRENDLQYLPLSLAYRGMWLGSAQPTVVDATLVLGMRGLLGNSDRQFDAKRAQASSSFAALKAGWQGSTELPGYAAWTVGAKVEGQLASGVLLPSEQFVGGGADSVRGYLEGERSGDQALRASFEISSPNTKLGDLLGWRIRGLAFIEGVVLQNLDTAAEVSRLQHLPSAKELLSKHRVEMQLAALNELVLTAASVADPASTSYVVSVAAAEDAGRESALHFTPPR
jgi:hemolysin activation/secretion protein